VGPEKFRIEYKAEWVQRGSEINTGLSGSSDGHNFNGEKKILFLVGN
jgi:hypothetical protein